jgi:cation transport ATPase
VIIVAGPAESRLAPLAILGALGRAARLGAIVKGGTWIEKIGTIDTVVFDNDRDSYAGQAEVIEIESAHEVSPSELLRVAASVEV